MERVSEPTATVARSDAEEQQGVKHKGSADFKRCCTAGCVGVEHIDLSRGDTVNMFSREVYSHSVSAQWKHASSI